MATIQARIEGRVGEAAGGNIGFTTVMLQDAYDHGLRAVIMAMPKEAWKYFGKNAVDFLPLVGTPLLTDKVINVLRNDDGTWRKCVMIEPEMAGPAADSNSIHYASEFTPVYFVDSGSYSNPMLKVLPEDGSKAARLVSVAIPTVDITTDTIVPHFPDELDELPEIYTVGWVKQRETGVSLMSGHTDLGNVISILGSTSPVTNSVNALLVAATATSPADEDALRHLANDMVEHARAATGIAQARIQEAAAITQAAIGKAAEAKAASDEAKSLQQEFDKKLNEYKAQFTKAPEVADRRRR